MQWQGRTSVWFKFMDIILTFITAWNKVNIALGVIFSQGRVDTEWSTSTMLPPSKTPNTLYPKTSHDHMHFSRSQDKIHRVYFPHQWLVSYMYQIIGGVVICGLSFQGNDAIIWPKSNVEFLKHHNPVVLQYSYRPKVPHSNRWIVIIMTSVSTPFRKLHK